MVPLRCSGLMLMTPSGSDYEMRVSEVLNFHLCECLATKILDRTKTLTARISRRFAIFYRAWA